MTDIQAKYQKLAAEYAKVRAQLPVLKKAVLDEQAKEEALKESLKEKEQSMRKYNQEVESLTFRNQQLSARVEVLQRELETMSRQGKKSQKKGASTPTTPPDSDISINNTVIGEELQAKIEENARLHKEVYETESRHREEVGELRERLMRLEEEADRHQAVLQHTQSHSEQKISVLADEKLTLQVKLQNQETECKEARQKLQNAEENLARIESDLKSRLSDATQTIQNKIPFNDTANKPLNSLNLPSHDRRRQLQTKELVSQAAGLIKELTQGLANLHTYSQQRIRLYPVDADLEPLSQVNKKLASHLQENAVILRRVELTFREFADSLRDDSLTTLETATGLQEFSQAWNTYVIYATKLLPYTLLSLEEESAVSSCSEQLEKKNSELVGGWQTFTAALSKLHTYISILANYSCSGCDQPASSQTAIFKLITTALSHFHDAVKDLSKQFNAKISLEHQLPTCSEKLKITDECIVSSLISLVTCTSKLSAFFGGNQDFLCKPHTSQVQCHPAVSDFRQRAVNYVTSLSRPCVESVPYTASVLNRQTLFSSTESRDSLAAQVVSLQEKVHKLEADKEHWMLESQLHQVKYDKQAKRMLEVEAVSKQLQARLAGDTSVDNHKVTPARSESVNVQTSMLGELSELACMESEEQLAREELIRRHFTQRISQLTTQLQLADSKALHFHAECRALHKRLSLAQADRDNSDRDLETANTSIAQLKDELQTTTRSYEGQLSMMSEHLAGMNEKLTTQKDEIDALKFHINNKSEKKGLFSSDKKTKRK